MDEPPVNLKDIVTRWSGVLLAQLSQGDTAAAARNDLLLRYHEAVQRYLRRELRDDHAADALLSNFAVRVLEADRFLKAADPARGRFRDYLKAVLYRMVMDHYRAGAAGKAAEFRDDLAIAGPVEPPSALSERQFLDCWKQELINQTWRALTQVEEQTGRPVATVMRMQEEEPGLRSARVAERLGAKLGRSFSADAVRQIIHRGRELFGDLLVQETARSLQKESGEKVDAARIEDELIELGLLFSYCKSALQRYTGGP